MARKTAKTKITRKAKAKTKAKVAAKRASKKSTDRQRTAKKSTTKKRVVKKTATSKKKKTKTSKRTTKDSAASPTKAKSSRSATASKSAKRATKPAATKKTTAKKTIAKKVAPKKTVDKKAEPVAPKPPPRKKRLKTPLNAKQLRGFKALLLAKRTELTGDMMKMTNQALNRNSGTGAESSTVPTHLAERGSDNWEQEFTLGLIANKKIVVREIDAALERIENRTYGICLGTEEPIAIPRLEAKPWAKHGIAYATLRDEGRIR